jgi:hypothetical protein
MNRAVKTWLKSLSKTTSKPKIFRGREREQERP